MKDYQTPSIEVFELELDEEIAAVTPDVVSAPLDDSTP